MAVACLTIELVGFVVDSSNRVVDIPWVVAELMMEALLSFADNKLHIAD